MLEIIYRDVEEILNRVDLSPLKNKRILISGASGLLGTYFLACLRKFQEREPSDLRIFALVASEPTFYFQKLCDFPGLEIIRGDLTDQSFQRSLPRADFIIHAAGYGQPNRFMESPIKTLHLNTAATFALFEKLNGAGKFLFIGTSEVYVGLESSPHRETQIGHTNTDHPRACYIEAKRCGEAICHSFRKAGIDAKIVRLALAYGPGTRPGDRRVLHSFIEKALRGEIDLLDQGFARRTYCYVLDAMEMLWNIFLEGKEAVYNVGGTSRITIRDLAIQVAGHLQVPVKFPKSAQELVGAPDDVQLDLSRVKNEFQKTDFISLEEGVRRTIAWQKAILDQSKDHNV
jgi:UDP-glucuronate decarboxylase